MNTLIVLPILIPLATACACLLAWRSRTIQRIIGVAGAAGQLTTALILLATVWREGVIATQLGNWPAPFGITLAADLLSAIMTVLGALNVKDEMGIDLLEDNWYRFAFAADGDTGILRAYVDGVEILAVRDDREDVSFDGQVGLGTVSRAQIAIRTGG